MKFQLILAAVSSLLFISFGQSFPTSQDAELALMNTCEPCGDDTLQQSSDVLMKKIKMTVLAEYRHVLRALMVEMQEAGVRYLSDNVFNLEECCGYESYLHSIDALTTMNKANIISHIMLLLRDVIAMGDVLSLDEANIRNLNNTLCALETVDATEKVDVCLKASPMATCSPGFTCDAKLNLSFLKSAHNMFAHLRTRL